MRKILIISIFFMCLTGNVKAQFDAAATVPILTQIASILLQVNGVMKKSEENLSGIKKAIGKVRDAEQFFKHAIAVREAINLLACLAESLTDAQFSRLLQLVGLPTNNLFSNFLTCQYDIYYSTINLDLDYITTNISRAFNPVEDLNVAQRLEMLNNVIASIENIRYKTVQARGILLEVMDKYIDAAIAEEFIYQMHRI